MFGRRLGIVGIVVIGVMALVSLGAVWAQSGPELSDTEVLGKAIFFDTDLSINQNQSCASCHDPGVGFTGPDSAINAAGAVYEGSVPGAFGDRKPPSAAYATQSPIFHLDKKGTFTGGNFWDGRATGEVLGNPAADQALGPFLNPNEQALSDAEAVVALVCISSYADLFKEVWGDDVCDEGNEDEAYGNIGLSIAAYEASPEVNAFSSKYDLKDKLSKEEQRGKALFVGKGKCAACHPSNGPQPLFTDFTFDNLGVPPNPANPALMAGPEFVDPALGGFLMNAGYDTDVYEEEWGSTRSRRYATWTRVRMPSSRRTRTTATSRPSKGLSTSTTPGTCCPSVREQERTPMPRLRHSSMAAGRHPRWRRTSTPTNSGIWD